MYYIISALLVVAVLLNLSMRNIEGHKKAKIIHVISVIALVFLFAGLIVNVVSFITYPQGSIDSFSKDAGIVSGEMNLIIFFVSLLFSIAVQVFVILLALRKNSGRLGLFYILPVSLFTYLGHFVRWVDSSSSLFDRAVIIKALPAVIFVLSVMALFYWIYNTRFMKAFFKQ